MPYVLHTKESKSPRKPVPAPATRLPGAVNAIAVIIIIPLIGLFAKTTLNIRKINNCHSSEQINNYYENHYDCGSEKPKQHKAPSNGAS